VDRRGRGLCGRPRLGSGADWPLLLAGGRPVTESQPAERQKEPAVRQSGGQRRQTHLAIPEAIQLCRLVAGARLRRAGSPSPRASPAASRPASVCVCVCVSLFGRECGWPDAQGSIWPPPQCRSDKRRAPVARPWALGGRLARAAWLGAPQLGIGRRRRSGESCGECRVQSLVQSRERSAESSPKSRGQSRVENALETRARRAARRRVQSRVHRAESREHSAGHRARARPKRREWPPVHSEHSGQSAHSKQ